ncbi:MAG: aminopeptidase N [Acidiferrobacterales bacterium]|nr:aminopeptidase N [Acidiferrobacterales bacterium]
MLENDVAPTLENTTIYLKDYQPPNYWITSVNLDFVLAETTTVTALSKVSRNGQHADDLVLNGEKLRLKHLKIDGMELTEQQYQLDAELLTLFSPPAEFELEVVTEIEPSKNTELSGLYQSSGNYCTQCEAEGFRRITYFLDRPDVLAKYDVKITANKKECPILLSNGNPIDSGKNVDGSHWQRWRDPHPKPSYLFALVAGDLKHITDKFKTVSGQKVLLNIYTQEHNIKKCQHAMDSLKKSMRWDEQVYGREYDLDIYNIVAVDDFNMGAMENKGLNIFNSKYVLADQESATDADYEGIESVVGHEYFHNWSGNRVTCRDWFQLSLKEGFTVFRDQEFSADMGSRAVKRIRDVQALRNYQFKEDAGPMAHPVRPDSYQEINNFYTVTIYEKGAEVIRMIHSLVGAEGFRKGTDLYFQRFDGQAVTTENFVQCMEQTNQIDLTQFRLWYTQSGTPSITVTQTFDMKDRSLTLEFMQDCPATPGQPDKKPFQIPVEVALIDQQGKELSRKTLSLTKKQQSFVFEELDQQPVVSLLRNFSAPINVEFAQTNEELAHLIRFDKNGFARWEAMQRLSLNLMLPAIKNSQDELDMQLLDQLKTVLAALLQEPCADKAILAEMLSLPASSYMAEKCKPIDPVRVYKIREQVTKFLATGLHAQLFDIYRDNNQSQSFSLSAESMAERALKNTALKYLVSCEQPEYYQLAHEQYSSANNMTDRLAAFGALVHSNYEQSEHLIEHFFARWHNDALVLDKWFAMQATVPRKNTLASVKALMKHSAFSINNPNKVRSLIGAFTSNMLGFHQADGQGYQLLADRIIELNKINPQIAARLVASFNNWRAYDEPYSGLMKAQLARISEQSNLAKDVKEIVFKALV